MRLQRNIIEINEGNTTVEMAIMKMRGDGGGGVGKVMGKQNKEGDVKDEG